MISAAVRPRVIGRGDAPNSKSSCRWQAVIVLDEQKASDVFQSLVPFVEHQSDGWAARWFLVLWEVERRGEIMGLEAAVASVRDDLVSGRL